MTIVYFIMKTSPKYCIVEIIYIYIIKVLKLYIQVPLRKDHSFTERFIVCFKWRLFCFFAPEEEVCFKWRLFLLLGTRGGGLGRLQKGKLKVLLFRDFIILWLRRRRERESNFQTFYINFICLTLLLDFDNANFIIFTDLEGYLLIRFYLLL